ncbi:MAG TPA: CHASE2 domain-containing protein [Burkholderiales bacterium]
MLVPRIRWNFAVKAVVVSTAGLLCASVFAYTTLYKRLDGWLQDALQRTVAAPIDLSDVLVVDIDDASLSTLLRALGPWPYTRDTFAYAQSYLMEHGARLVVYDLLLADVREGDEKFSTAARHNVVYAGAGFTVPLPITPAYRTQLETLAIGRDDEGQPVEGETPFGDGYRYWSYLKLPLTSAANSRAVGVMNIQPDEDGVVRRAALFHGTQGYVLPSLSLAALIAAHPEQVETDWPHRNLRVRRVDVPLTDGGEALLRYPSNTDELRVIPFYELMFAATQSGPSDALPLQVKNKTVFIGSSSFAAGTHAYTPMERMAGVQLSALTYAMLANRSVLAPPRLALDGAIAIFALVLPLLLLWRGLEASGRAFLLIFFGLPPLCFGIAIALLMGGHQSNWLYAMTAGLAAWTGVLAIWLFDLANDQRRLRYEAIAAREANRLKSDFLNQVTHELRTPLTAIMGFNKINQYTEDLGRDSRIKNSEIIGRNCDHLLALINNNLDLAKMETGSLIIAPAPEDPEQLCRDIVTTLQPVADEKRLRLKFTRATELPAALMLDAFRIRQVLMNLLGNALKFTQHGTVELASSWHSATLVLEVRDTGTGIPADALERIFHPYEQVDAKVAQRFGGTGLGLAITRTLVELMDGAIEVESEPGVGSLFRVRLPAEVTARPDTVRPITDARPMENLSGRVLIAEDNEDIRALIELQLARLGVETVSVPNGLAAVETALATRFDAVLIDMEMPVMNGFEAINVLRTRNYQGTILALTAHQEGMEIERALASGCDGVVRKPASIESLRTALRPVLRGSRRATGGA